VLAVLGVIALRQGDSTAARQAFAEAIAQAEALLSKTRELYDTLDSKALALCGLALCENPAHTAAASEACRAARTINKDAGVVGRVVRVFDALAAADREGILKGVRAAAEGVG
nr:hypothetical protein [Pseudomonadota bacterium]